MYFVFFQVIKVFFFFFFLTYTPQTKFQALSFCLFSVFIKHGLSFRMKKWTLVFAVWFLFHSLWTMTQMECFFISLRSSTRPFRIDFYFTSFSRQPKQIDFFLRKSTVSPSQLFIPCLMFGCRLKSGYRLPVNIGASVQDEPK